jgi:hypothetical protein
MSCRKHSPGNPCCVPPDCTSLCEDYLPSGTWDVQAQGQTVTLAQHPTYKCYYQAEVCWLSTMDEIYGWSLSSGWENGGMDSPSIPNPCVPTVCNGLTYDILQTQIHYRTAAKLYRQTRHTLFVSIGPATPASTLLKATIIYGYRQRYIFGWSETAHVRYRISTGVCPAAATPGSWVSSSAPSMPSVQVPSFFYDCPSFVLNNSFASCPFDLGSPVSPTTWGTTPIGPIRTIRTDSGCYTQNLYVDVPNDIAIRKSDSQLNLYLGGYCSDRENFQCDSELKRERTYVSSEFDCSDIPASIVCSSGLSTIPNFDVTAEGCGGGDVTYTIPGIAGSLTLTL